MPSRLRVGHRSRVVNPQPEPPNALDVAGQREHLRRWRRVHGVTLLVGVIAIGAAVAGIGPADPHSTANTLGGLLLMLGICAALLGTLFRYMNVATARTLEGHRWRTTEAYFVKATGDSNQATILALRDDSSECFWQVPARWREPVIRLEVAGDGKRRAMRRDERGVTMLASALRVERNSVRLGTVGVSPDQARLRLVTDGGVAVLLSAPRQPGDASLASGDRGTVRALRDVAMLVLGADETPRRCKVVSERKARRTWSMFDER